MRVVVVGHVDHGKSTLIGRLFHDAGALPEGRIAQLNSAAERRGMPFEFANLTDGLQAERDQNVTIDTTQVLFRWQGQEVLFIDAPGHREFIKNMITGAARADAALLVIEAVDGVSDQTRRHALLLTILGVSHVIVIVNKLDLVDAGDRQRRFDAVAAAATDMLHSLHIAPAAIVPASASLGWNVANRADELGWFAGPTLAEAVFALRTALGSSTIAAQPAVFSVQDVYRRDARRWLVGRLESGTLAPGDPVVVNPSGQAATIDLNRYVQQGFDSPEGTALTIREPLFVSRGDVLSSPDAPLIVANVLDARIFWLGRTPMSPERRYEVRLGTQRADATVTAIRRVVNASELTERADRSDVPAHDVADIELTLSRPLTVDPLGHARALARLVIVDALPSPDIVGGGVVLPTTAPMARAAAPASSERLTMAERHRRLGHRGAVVWLTGLSGAGKSTLANGLERALFARGIQSVVLDGDRMRFGLNADLDFSPEQRHENIRRVAEVAKLFAEIGVIAITAFISPYATDRRLARDIVSRAASGIPFIEVFVDTDLAVCEGRDVKGLYRKARAGEIADFTGVSAPYDVPAAADVVIRTADCSPGEGVAQLMESVLGEAYRF
jgi:bifunctional enzyme CysN/CysC